MLTRFIIYGLIGWCMEIAWTGLGAAFSGDKRFEGHTYLWMFPIYGSAVFLEPIHNMIMGWPVLMRGGLWVVIIFFMEFVSGWMIKSSIGICPWDYGKGKYAVMGLIRLDYAPAWLAAGLIFERVHMLLESIL